MRKKKQDVLKRGGSRKRTRQKMEVGKGRKRTIRERGRKRQKERFEERAFWEKRAKTLKLQDNGFSWALFKKKEGLGKVGPFRPDLNSFFHFLECSSENQKTQEDAINRHFSKPQENWTKRLPVTFWDRFAYFSYF